MPSLFSLNVGIIFTFLSFCKRNIISFETFSFSPSHFARIDSFSAISRSFCTKNYLQTERLHFLLVLRSHFRYDRHKRSARAEVISHANEKEKKSGAAHGALRRLSDQGSYRAQGALARADAGCPRAARGAWLRQGAFYRRYGGGRTGRNVRSGRNGARRDGRRHGALRRRRAEKRVVHRRERKHSARVFRGG